MVVAEIDVGRRFALRGLARLVRLLDLAFFLGHSFLQVINSEFTVFDALADPAGRFLKLFTHGWGKKKFFCFIACQQKIIFSGVEDFFKFLQKETRKIVTPRKNKK